MSEKGPKPLESHPMSSARDRARDLADREIASIKSDEEYIEWLKGYIKQKQDTLDAMKRGETVPDEGGQITIPYLEERIRVAQGYIQNAEGRIKTNSFSAASMLEQVAQLEDEINPPDKDLDVEYGLKKSKPKPKTVN